MKKKILALLLTTALCLSLAIPCFAASKPAVEVMWTSFYMNYVGGVEPTIYYRNNSGKTIKYIDWYLTAYNAVGDPVRCDVRRKSTVIAETVGPIPTFVASPKPSSDIYANTDGHVDNDNPFKQYNILSYYINDGDNQKAVYSDKNGNFFSHTSDWIIGSNDTYAYLTDDEVRNAIYDGNCKTTFEVCWYNTTIDDFRVAKAVVTFMDGSKTTVSSSNVYSKYYNHHLTNGPFMSQLSKYSAVYSYSDYVKYNPDLAAAFGDNQKALFEHFINNGMKEGRQASSEFNLAAYKANNPDLVSIFGDDNAKYYEHYISSGKAEGRKATVPLNDTSTTTFDSSFTEARRKVARPSNS